MTGQVRETREDLCCQVRADPELPRLHMMSSEERVIIFNWGLVDIGIDPNEFARDDIPRTEPGLHPGRVHAITT